MKKFAILFIVATVVLLGAVLAFAAPSTTQTVQYAVSAINEIAVSADPATLTMSTATAGSLPDVVIESSTTYSLTTNNPNKKITGVLDSNMPADLLLTIELASPGITGWTSAGEKTLTNVAADLATGGDKGTASAKGITYRLKPNAVVPDVQSGSRTLTLTLSN